MSPLPVPGGTASAANPASVHVQRSDFGVNSADYRWDHGVGYLTDQGYCWDENRGWNSLDDRCYRWDDEGHEWKSDRSYRHDWNRHESDGRPWDHYDRNHGGR
ncbi:hypothetical protein [Streptomyces griseofuscus]|uniref:hypothetical protein n=1 Tax=Streptomyces griseofuscus TaxID=146922 RepID=UPI0038142AF1